MTSMSGATPSFSTAQPPSVVRKRKVGTVRVPPSTRGGVAGEAGEAAPGAGADQRPQAQLAEVVGEGVAARAGLAVDQGHLRAGVGEQRRRGRARRARFTK